MDSEEEDLDMMPKREEKVATKMTCYSGLKVGNCQNPLSKLEESVEGEEEEEEAAAESEGEEKPFRVDECAGLVGDQVPAISKLSMSLKNISIGEKSWQHQGAIAEGSYLAGTSSRNRSVNKQLPANTSSVKLADMNEEEWAQFLEKFKKLLYPAFANHKSGSVGQRQRQRLGTSCQF
ncbi:hypothetical protein L1049_002371 [Liquidambar formosana]|uniref:1-phosphatidylinositol 4-kinase n=1 Tax=Liquidambar formosana TaxID=63359 RepID=A0AAP0NH73_LIQFO